MVAIVDADSFPVLASRKSEGDDLFLSWIHRRHGKLAISDAGQYFKELSKNHAVMELIRRYGQGGQLRLIPADQLSVTDGQIEQTNHRSNDSHILSLALASNAKVLCSNDDDLRADFKNKDILPSMGRQRRLLYPFAGSRKQRREFLNRQRCPDRQGK
ncbi:MAG: hypothetical protein OXB95_11785 [Rhodobacteraceae bacterium]|nr:hypothetical protein [Paracoccaceae bacterium]